MAEEDVTMKEQTPEPMETLETAQNSAEATIESAAVGGTESTCNNTNNDNGEASGVVADGDREKSLEFGDELMEKGKKALREMDYGEATDCFSRALEIRVAHYGELALECVNAYYQYGRALLYKAQDEADPLGAVPKKESEQPDQGSVKAGSIKNTLHGESSIASVSSKAEQDGSSNNQAGAADDASGGKNQEEDEEGSDDEDLAEAEAEADEDDSDLDLAWKMLDVARAIAEKHSGDTMEKADILSALAEASLEREDIETSLGDYEKALSIVERLVEPDSRYIAELNFRICLCLEIGCKSQEAIPYCQKAISVCKARVQRLKNEVNGSSELATSSAVSELDDGIQQSSNGPQNDKLVTNAEAEIETLTSLCGELEKKLEDLQQLVLNPKSILSEILGMASAKAKGNQKSAAAASFMSSSQMGTVSGGFDSPTASTAHTSGAASEITHLGVVGRGVKRVSMGACSVESSPKKKPATDPSA